MKILLSNKYYYPRGGDCNYAIGLELLLKSKGHEIAFFAMNHPLNKATSYSNYFPSEIDFSKRDISGIVKKMIRPLGSTEVKKKFRTLLNEFKPDIIHVNNIHSQLSPIIVKEAYKHNIPVIWTLHDYKLLCPRYDCMRNKQPCELCYNARFEVVHNRCVKNSLLASIMGYVESRIWSKAKLEKYTSQFICPSEFMRQKMISGGFAAEKLITLNNFVNFSNEESSFMEKEDYYCYVGRLSQEKGVETLLKAAMELPQIRLMIIGEGPLSGYFKGKYKAKHIEFCGQKTNNEVKTILSKAVFMVIPSEWYENNPLSVIESLCVGTPVLGANIGGIPELIETGKNGLLFQSGNVHDLMDKIKYFWRDQFSITDRKKISENAKSRFSIEKYYTSVFQIYHEALASKKDVL
jgi:glycosyltransferase involved in cell wall biosynthesis